MNRRQFVKLTGAGVSVGALAGGVVSAQVAKNPAPAAPATKTSPKARMRVGTQQGDAEGTLRALAAFGVNNICGSLPSVTLDEAWTVDALSKRRDRVMAHGISLDMLPPPMSSHEIGTIEMPAIYLGRNPDRDRNINDICQMIRNCSRAGISQVKYNFTLLGVVRTGTAAGRGTARYSEFAYAAAKPAPPLTIARKVDAHTNG